MRAIILDRKDDSHNSLIIYWYKSFDNINKDCLLFLQVCLMSLDKFLLDIIWHKLITSELGGE